MASAARAIGERELDGLPDVHLVGEVVPRRRLRKAIDELTRVGLDAQMLSHAGELARRNSGRKQMTHQER